MRISASPLELNPATATDPAKIDKVARQLEGQFAQMLIKSMRDASFGDSLFTGENQMFREMYDKQLAEAMTKGRGLGLSSMIARQLGGDASASTPATDPSLVRPAAAARAYRLASPAP
ncbi:rod-binding protein, partial [Stenotrophomonas sp. YIM B06876]|uniref:rod-binding protein n=1 Tax=Stenotrophomonas sp. YIM B06876 TaxID=3060211 RepID=UPI00273864CE